MGNLEPGRRLGAWKVAAIHPVTMGAIPVILLDAKSRPFQVDVLRQDLFGPCGLADSPSLTVFLSNGGDGQLPTVEDHGGAAITLAKWLRRREHRGAAVPRALLTWTQRLQRFPAGKYCVLS